MLLVILSVVLENGIQELPDAEPPDPYKNPDLDPDPDPELDPDPDPPRPTPPRHRTPQTQPQRG